MKLKIKNKNILVEADELNLGNIVGGTISDTVKQLLGFAKGFADAFALSAKIGFAAAQEIAKGGSWQNFNNKVKRAKTIFDKKSSEKWSSFRNYGIISNYYIVFYL